MKKQVLIIISTILSLSLSSEQAHCFTKKRWVVDKIVTRVNGKNILQSDLCRPRVDKNGQFLTLEDAILEETCVQQAQEKHMMPTQADIKRQVVSLKIANDISDMNDEDFEKQLKQELNISVEQYEKQLGRILAAENIKQSEISEKIFVSSQEVEKIYEKNPEYTKDQYLLHLCSIQPEQVDNYQTLIKEGKVHWKDLGWVNKEDIDSQFSEVLSMNPQEINKPIKADNKYIVLKLEDKKLSYKKTLQERYGAIEKKLQEKKQKSILIKFKENLIKSALIVFL